MKEVGITKFFGDSVAAEELRDQSTIQTLLLVQYVQDAKDSMR